MKTNIFRYSVKRGKIIVFPASKNPKKLLFTHKENTNFLLPKFPGVVYCESKYISVTVADTLNEKMCTLGSYGLTEHDQIRADDLALQPKPPF